MSFISDFPQDCLIEERIWIDLRYLHLKRHFSTKNCQQMLEAIQFIERHPEYKHNSSANNSAVNDKFRSQAIIYSINWFGESKETTERVGAFFNYCSEALFPIIVPALYGRVKNLVGDWNIVRATVMQTYLGCPEQEIHYDFHEGTKIFLISIPLHDTPIDQGPTIFYEDKILKGLQAHVIGYFKNLKSDLLNIFTSARRQESLKLGDFTIHDGCSLHSGGENKIGTRKFIFLTCASVGTGWRDYIEIKADGLHVLHNEYTR